MLWKFLLTPSNGAINAALLELGLISEHIEWFNAGVSLWSIIIADVWNWTALPLLIIYSGRVSLPPTVYEAAASTARAAGSCSGASPSRC